MNADQKEDVMIWAGLGLFTGAWAVYFAFLGFWLGIITFSCWALYSLGLAGVIYCEAKKFKSYLRIKRMLITPR